MQWGINVSPSLHLEIAAPVLKRAFEPNLYGIPNLVVTMSGWFIDLTDLLVRSRTKQIFVNT